MKEEADASTAGVQQLRQEEIQRRQTNIKLFDMFLRNNTNLPFQPSN
jgi:hypothetical protein